MLILEEESGGSKDNLFKRISKSENMIYLCSNINVSKNEFSEIEKKDIDRMSEDLCKENGCQGISEYEARMRQNAQEKYHSK
jgi:hypothetical protein